MLAAGNNLSSQQAVSFVAMWPFLVSTSLLQISSMLKLRILLKPPTGLPLISAHHSLYYNSSDSQKSTTKPHAVVMSLYSPESLLSNNAWVYGIKSWTHRVPEATLKSLLKQY